METILCPTSFSRNSENAIRYADEIAQRMNSRLILFHSIPEPVGLALATANEEAEQRSYREDLKEKAVLSRLKNFQAYLESTEWGIPVGYDTKVGYGPTSHTIISLARKEQADLVVLST